MSTSQRDPLAKPLRPDPLGFLEDEVAALRERHLYRGVEGRVAASECEPKPVVLDLLPGPDRI